MPPLVQVMVQITRVPDPRVKGKVIMGLGQEHMLSCVGMRMHMVLYQQAGMEMGAVEEAGVAEIPLLSASRMEERVLSNDHTNVKTITVLLPLHHWIAVPHVIMEYAVVVLHLQSRHMFPLQLLHLLLHL